VEDYELAEAAWLAAIKRWPKENIVLRQGARVVRDSRPGQWNDDDFDLSAARRRGQSWRGAI
jgi:hypothetical protein